MSDIPEPEKRKNKNILVQIIAVVVLVIVVGAVAVVAMHPSAPSRTIQPAVQPSFKFLSPSYLTVAYGMNITSQNYTSNLTSSVYGNISTTGVEKGEMYLYGVNASSSSGVGSLDIGIAILDLSSSSDANVSLQAFSSEMHKVNGVSITYGNVSGFRFVNVTDNSTSFPYSIYYGVYGNWVLLIEFVGQATAHEYAIFEAQASLMLGS